MDVPAIDVGSEFMSYKEGVYSGTCGKPFNQAVKAVGYGVTEDGTKYWLIKNQWGKDWGEGGYMRVLRENGDLRGQCGHCCTCFLSHYIVILSNEFHSISSCCIAISVLFCPSFPFLKLFASSCLCFYCNEIQLIYQTKKHYHHYYTQNNIHNMSLSCPLFLKYNSTPTCLCLSFNKIKYFSQK